MVLYLYHFLHALNQLAQADVNNIRICNYYVQCVNNTFPQNTPLHYAARKKGCNLKVVQFLADCEANLNSKDNDDVS